MPLHLLGKKSWNVYNPDNIERVRRDEAKAQAEAVEKEQLRQDAESDKRLALLRGHDGGLHSEVSTRDSHHDAGLERGQKHRRLDDDEARTCPAVNKSARQHTTDDGFLLGSNGRNGGDFYRAREDQMAARSDGKFDKAADQQGMRLSDAAGYGANASQPWYRTAPDEGKYQSSGTGRDVWGNEDPRRYEREQHRVTSNDPLAAMKRGVRQLRKAESDRKEWKAQRERDLTEVEQLAREEHKHRKHRRRRKSKTDSLDNFDLDGGYQHKSEERRPESDERYRHRHHPHHRHRYRKHRSTSRDKARSCSPKRSRV